MIGEMYVIRNPYDPTDSKRLKKLQQGDDKEVKVQEVLELIEEHNRQKRNDVVSRVVNFVGHIVAGKHLSIAVDSARCFLNGLK